MHQQTVKNTLYTDMKMHYSCFFLFFFLWFFLAQCSIVVFSRLQYICIAMQRKVKYAKGNNKHRVTVVKTFGRVFQHLHTSFLTLHYAPYSLLVSCVSCGGQLCSK